MKRLTLLLSVILLATACAKKKTTEDAGATPTDAQVTTKDIGFDPMGSDSGKITGLQSIHFDYDQSALSPQAMNALKNNVRWMQDNKNVNIQVEGHCDDRGSIEYNLALGERRAKATKNYLVSMGVASNRLTIISYGKEKPLVMGDSESDFAQNRRANFVPLSR